MSISLAVMGCIAASGASPHVVAEPMNGSDTVFTTPHSPSGSARASVRWNYPDDGGPGWAGTNAQFVGPIRYEWLVIGSPSDFQILFTQSAGDAVTGSALNTWHSLGSIRDLTLSVTATGHGATRTANGTYQIRRASTGDVVDSSTWSLHAEIIYASG